MYVHMYVHFKSKLKHMKLGTQILKKKQQILTMHSYKNNRINNSFYVIIIIFVLISNYVLSTPMLYKRNPDAKYERDLVAVSSTVVPLTVLEVSYGLGGQPSEEYKEAYLKKLRKKVRHESNKDETDEQPDTLITIKKKHYDASDKSKVAS